MEAKINQEEKSIKGKAYVSLDTDTPNPNIQGWKIPAELKCEVIKLEEEKHG